MIKEKATIHDYENSEQWHATFAWIIAEYQRIYLLAEQESNQNNQEMVLMKAIHTNDVVEQMIRIYQGLEESNTLPSEVSFLPIITIALLHDVARPAQAYANGSFDDEYYEHADIGADMVRDDSPIDDENAEDFDFIVNAIRGHNKIQALDNHPYSLLIRDADKLAILLRIEYYSDPERCPAARYTGSHTTFDLMNPNPDQIMDNKMRETKIDSLLNMLYWFQDLNFDVSKKLFFEDRVPERIFALMEESFNSIEEDSLREESLAGLENIKKVVSSWKNQ